MSLRKILIPVALVAVAACHSDSVTTNARPPLGGVRFINAVPDGGPVDIRYVDQVDWSGSSVNGTNIGLAFRAGTIHWATEAKARHIRVFPSDSNITVASQILLDTTITVEANKNVTLLLVGSRAAGGKVRFVKIDDTPPTLGATQIAVRLVNASQSGATTAAANGYLTATATSSLPATANFTNVGTVSVSPYVVRDTGSFAIRTASPTDNTNIFASAAAPAGAPASGLIGATAGASGPGSALSAYLFPASVAGTAAPQTAAFQAPQVIWYVDKVPNPPTLP